MSNRLLVLLAVLSSTSCASRSRDAPTPPPTTAREPATEITMSPDSPFAPLAFLIGRWQGEEEAVFGRGRGTREYRLVLGGTYLLSDNEADYPAQDGLPKAQHHQDWTIFSFDRAAKRLALRQLNSEGFLNYLVLDPASRIPDHLVFVSEHTENAPPGMRVRLTLSRVSADELAETFELAEPGGDFQFYVRTRWTRKR